MGLSHWTHSQLQQSVPRCHDERRPAGSEVMPRLKASSASRSPGRQRLVVLVAFNGACASLAAEQVVATMKRTDKLLAVGRCIIRGSQLAS